MPNLHKAEAKRTRESKIHKMVGRKDGFRHPDEKAHDLANLEYHENEGLDPLTRPPTDEVGP